MINASDYMVENVKLSDSLGLWWLPIIILLLITALAVIILRRRRIAHTISGGQPPPDPIDYRKHSKEMLEESKKMFAGGQKKDAYARAAEAIRFYYRHYLKLERQLTNTELIDTLRSMNRSYENVKDCLNLCALVEFAKYEANKKDFDEIIIRAEKIIE